MILQTFSILLYALPVRESEEDRVRRVMRVLDVLRGFHPSVFPQYETAWSKKKARAFVYTPDTVRELLRENVNREGNVVFSELGTSLSFFTSMDEDKSAGLAFHVGITTPDGVNSFVLHFPIEPPVLQQHPPFTARGLWSLFKDLVVAFQPYWGALVNNRNFDRFLDLPYPEDRRPKTVHWMNYFGSSILERIGEKRLLALPNVHTEHFESGVALRILDDPLDDDDIDHLTHQYEINRRLDLSGRLVKPVP